MNLVTRNGKTLTSCCRRYSGFQSQTQQQSDQKDIAEWLPRKKTPNILHGTDRKRRLGPPFNFNFCCGEDSRQNGSVSFISIHHKILLIPMTFAESSFYFARQRTKMLLMYSFYRQFVCVLFELPQNKEQGELYGTTLLDSVCGIQWVMGDRTNRSGFYESGENLSLLFDRSLVFCKQYHPFNATVSNERRINVCSRFRLQ